jgi:hypothetical protein
MSCEIVIHPPIIEAKRAWKHAGQMRTAKSYLSRNKDIVRDTEMLVAAPDEGHRADSLRHLVDGPVRTEVGSSCVGDPTKRECGLRWAAASGRHSRRQIGKLRTRLRHSRRLATRSAT